MEVQTMKEHLPKQVYSTEVRAQAVLLGTRAGLRRAAAGRRGVPEAEAEVARLRRAVVELRLERARLKTASACRARPKRGSMSRKGNCYDNAPGASFWGPLKTELVPHRK
jgi:transposase InsO family protein